MDEPTNGELGRLIQALRSDVRDDLGQINARLDRVVPMDVYTVEKTTITDRVTALEQAREKDATRITATRRWVIGTVITVVAVLLPYLGTVVRGAGA
ncbi:hypothetical protein GCM10010400_75680 [Streptomyces aculeolatus]|uniref:hypothetical protein n=1 Tax=Streptomyces aculeolatus TaxID=270689 RepID=UPI001CECA5E2|nr:hypothetical protein [Streptomyces aculeolatus]